MAGRKRLNGATVPLGQELFAQPWFALTAAAWYNRDPIGGVK